MKNFCLEIRTVDRGLRDWNTISGIELIERVFGEVIPEPTYMTIRARTQEGKWVNISIPFDGIDSEPSAWIADEESGNVE